MALEITAQGSAKLIISGTTTELTSIYSRIEFALVKTGEAMQGALYNYFAKTDYETDDSSLLRIKDFLTSYTIQVDVAGGEEQSLLLGHQKIQADLEALGYTVVIVDLS